MEPLVEITEGLVKGTIKTDFNGEYFKAFLCIPYGKPPVGDLRFKAPQPVEPWQGVKDATKEENYCYQLNFHSRIFVGSEDCLSLHVFTKKLPQEEKRLKPVMVFIHGGGFIMGTPETNLFGAEYLMTEDIVLVCIAYRLGIFGFLSLDDPSLDIPGNAGLKDQVLALKWVQKNIKYFNGDPSNVTIFGESAGSASVEHLLLSPSAKNLFHKAIAQSGSVLNHWALGYFEPLDFAKYIGKPNISEKELLDVLRAMTVEELYDTQIKYIRFKEVPGDFGMLAPVIEKPNPTAFLTKEPLSIIQSGDYNSVPVIIGYNTSEGIIFEYLATLSPTGKMEIPIEKMLPYEMNKKDGKRVKRMVEKIKSFYCTDSNSNNPLKLMTDAYFVAGILTSARNQVEASNHPVYFYRFDLVTKLNFMRNLGIDYEGASHADELGYLFKNILPVEIGEPEKVGRNKVLKLWTNFAKYGNPTPPGNDLNIIWEPVESGKLNYLQIGNELKMDVNPDADRMAIWNEIYELNPHTSKY